MSYPQPPQYPQHPQYPQGAMPAPPAGQMAAGPPASSGTAIASGVLAILGGLWALLMIVFMGIGIAAASDLGVSGSDLAMSYVQLVLQVAVAGTLLAGAIMLFIRKKAGMWLVAAGCVLVLMTYLIGIIVAASGGGLSDVEGAGLAAGGAILLVFMVPAIVTLILVLVPPTKRWLDEGKPAQPQAYGPPGYQPHQQW